MIKLIVCDLDGTLLDKYQLMSQFTVDTLQKCIANNVELMFATGRDYNMVYEYLDDYNLSCDLVLNNGTQYKTKDLKDHCFFPLDHDTLRKVIHILQEYDYQISIHTTNGKYIFEDLDEYYNQHIHMIQVSRPEEDVSKFKACFFRKDGFLYKTTRIDSIEELFENGVEALKLDCKNPSIEKAKIGIEKLKQLTGINLSSSYEAYVEVTSDTSDKGKLLYDIMVEKGYTNDEVVVFGDGTNDIQMLTIFNKSYCPSNGHIEAKNAAKEVILSNEENGVALKLIEILKKENGITL